MSDVSLDSGHFPVGFSKYPGTYGLLSDSTATRRAIFFVHGFWGDAEATWQEFQRLIDTSKFATEFSDVDLFFYDYPSQANSVKTSAENLGTFVRHVLEEGPWGAVLAQIIPARWVATPVRSGTSYEEVVLVGHSLGGVVVRKLIVTIAESREGEQKDGQWPLLVRQPPRLFAPAHAGFRQGDLVSLLAGHVKIAALIIGWWRYRHAKVYGELQPGSVTLNGLKARTLAARLKRPGCPPYLRRCCGESTRTSYLTRTIWRTTPSKASRARIMKRFANPLTTFRFLWSS